MGGSPDARCPSSSGRCLLFLPTRRSIYCGDLPCRVCALVDERGSHETLARSIGEKFLAPLVFGFSEVAIFCSKHQRVAAKVIHNVVCIPGESEGAP
eukprot:5302421-Pleurochrysis_carterae.AAC.1